VRGGMESVKPATVICRLAMPFPRSKRRGDDLPYVRRLRAALVVVPGRLRIDEQSQPGAEDGPKPSGHVEGTQVAVGRVQTCGRLPAVKPLGPDWLVFVAGRTDSSTDSSPPPLAIDLRMRNP